MARRRKSSWNVVDISEANIDDPSDEESELYGTSDDEEYVPDEEVDFSYEYDSDSDDSVVIDQETRERSILRPDTWLKSKDGRIQYSKEDLPQNIRRNVIPGSIRKGPTAFASARVVDPFSAFLLLLKPIEKIVLDMTNLYGIRKYGEKWQMIDLKTLYAYFGLLILAGVYRSKGECVTELWDDKRGRPIFRATMSLNYFRLLNSCIRFDDKNTRNVRRQRDKLAAIREVFEKWNKHLKTLYSLGDSVTVDEQLIPYRGKSPFTQYIPSKPYKYGIKVWALCDSYTYYAYNMQIYTGRGVNQERERNQGQRVVLDLTEGLSGCNVTCDSLFTSYDLAKELKQRKMTIVGTVRKNRKEIPPCLLDMKRKPNFYSEFVFEPSLRLTMVSYVPKKNKYVVLLSTLHTKKEVRQHDDDKKPEIIHYYNATKGGVDVLDERVGTYRCKRKVNRWPMAIFANMIDVSGFNAFVIFTELFPQWKEKEKKYRRRLFLIEVGEQLVLPYIDSRKTLPKANNANALVKQIRGIPDEPSSSGILEKLPKNNKRGRCYICTSKTNHNLY
ncbi:piggyBac transposable element-derived protein 1-like, partial [Sitodiplosis mosellana]|uniref:piggyBac transposable element-derived protein 1-like n=1 Tax=Sitodiplosis mosellana TaxID=263140 RepID=UPI002444536B